MSDTLERIYSSVLKFLDPLSVEETYSTILDEATKLVGGDFGSILLAKNGELSRVFTNSPLTANNERSKTDADKCFHGKKAILANSPKEAGVKSTLLIPLLYRNNSIGVLILNSKQTGRFTVQELNILKLFGSMASMAIRKTQLYEETKQALDTRDLFISMASHELRTPLTTINGYIHLLYSRLTKRKGDEARWIQDLSNEAKRMTKLVQELLAINQIKSGQLQYVFMEYHISEIIERALKDMQMNYPEHQITFNSGLGSGNDSIICDYDKLLQVLLNVLTNASKFSRPDKQILVKLKLSVSNVIITIEDKGVGISKEDLPKIFDGFYKGTDHYQGGMGVGLYLAKDIMDHHHGTIKVSSRKRQGTTVELRLPRVQS